MLGGWEVLEDKEEREFASGSATVVAIFSMAQARLTSTRNDLEIRATQLARCE